MPVIVMGMALLCILVQNSSSLTTTELTVRCTIIFVCTVILYLYIPLQNFKIKVNNFNKLFTINNSLVNNFANIS